MTVTTIRFKHGWVPAVYRGQINIVIENGQLLVTAAPDRVQAHAIAAIDWVEVEEVKE